MSATVKQENQPKTGARCTCKRGVHRDNCPNCEGTGWVIDFAAIRARHQAPATITRKQALAFIDGRAGKFFAVRFTKRSNGETREMSCRQGVKAHLAGGEPAYDFESKGLIPVYDMQAAGYRSIPVEGITAVKMDGEWVEVV